MKNKVSNLSKLIVGISLGVSIIKAVVDVRDRKMQEETKDEE